jgi:ankyrin repeat protein
MGYSVIIDTTADGKCMFRVFVLLLTLCGLCLAPAMASDAAAIKRFHEAVHIGDINTVTTMIGADPALATSTDEYGFQPVHLLDMYFDENILDLLLANGADINAKNAKGVTLLHIVTDPTAVAAIVNKGGDVEARDVNGWTPLIMQASEPGNDDVIAALLAKRADPNARGNDGQTALAFARQVGDMPLMQLLMRDGALK